MTLTLYHNPRCTKSREGKRILDDEGIPYKTVLYLEDPPKRDVLAKIAERLERPSEMLRMKEAKAAGWDPADDADDPQRVARFLAKHPEALQRPILTDTERAVIGRPPERLRELL